MIGYCDLCCGKILEDEEYIISLNPPVFYHSECFDYLHNKQQAKMSNFKEITQEEFKAQATADKLIISRALGTSQYDVPTQTQLELSLAEVVQKFLEENYHADFLCATVFHDGLKTVLYFKRFEE